MDGKIKHVAADGSVVILDAHPTIKNHATLALRQWTTMDSGGQNRGDSTVLLHVSHSNLARHFHELRLDLHMTVGALKDKLRSHTGTGSAHAYLTLLDDSNQPVRGAPHGCRDAALAGGRARAALDARWLHRAGSRGIPFAAIAEPLAPSGTRRAHALTRHAGRSADSRTPPLRICSPRARARRAQIADMDDDSRMLGYYSPYDGCTVHVRARALAAWERGVGLGCLWCCLRVPVRALLRTTRGGACVHDLRVPPSSQAPASLTLRSPPTAIHATLPSHGHSPCDRPATHCHPRHPALTRP